jgi:cytoskeleton protein RodZ
VALAIVVLIALAMWHTNNGDSTAWLARLKGIAGVPAATTDKASAAVGESASGAAASAASQAQTDTQAAAVDSASATPMPAPLPMAGAAPASTAASASVTSAGSASTPAAAVPKAASAAPAASEPPAAPAGSSTVALVVKQDSWFSVRQKDGKEMFSGLVHAGETKEVSGLPPLKVTVGNRAGLESITLDGQPVDPAKYASAKGNVARFALP